MNGYAHCRYAASLSELGGPIPLPSCGGWLLVRQVPGTDCRDAMGQYPLFCCQDWSRLCDDLERLRGDLVSAVLITDPLAYIPHALFEAYMDTLSVYKQHYVLRFCDGWETALSSSHRKKARRALKTLRVVVEEQPLMRVDEWADLYSNLVRRHSLKGVHLFSRRAFAAQLGLPGCVLFRVLHEGAVVGGNVFYVSGSCAHGHLSAFTDKGYALRAPYAVKLAAFEYLASRVDSVDIGGTPDASVSSEGGLAHFKMGWSNEVRPAYLCGKVLNREVYDWLAARCGHRDSAYFPAYRAGEQRRGK